MFNQKYGVVYTPDSLAEFVASLLYRFSDIEEKGKALILDPASGECSLLRAAKKCFGEYNRYVGIDVDLDVTQRTGNEFEIIHNDTILPKNVKRATDDYWREKLQSIDLIIANPPWSSEKVYERGKLTEAGYSLISGQYDSYVLFMELAYKILRNDGTMAFIIPDSIFDAQNERLRQFLVEKMQIKVIARLGEKIFDEVNRATTVIVCKKSTPDENSMTECFRLSTDNRKAYLSGKGELLSFYEKESHAVQQSRFARNCAYHFDIDTHEHEEELIKKISSDRISWKNEFIFGRGVEISKSGKIVYCPHCGRAQGYSKKHIDVGNKKCVYCGKEISVNHMTIANVITEKYDNGTKTIYVGENVQRYVIQGECYIRTGIDGINYKTQDIYSPPKILIRKTGLGIYATVDYSGNYTSQTVYILRYAKDNDVPLEYYLALINSRVVYYYYLKVYGENEWKSHPYLTKQIIFTLPLRPYKGDEVDKEITRLARSLVKRYDRENDIQLERLIMKKYKLNKKEQRLIINEMNRLPDLSAINNMKMEA
jgi:tRNA1(Val) A37 N6-methylase TrmN6